jgi:hypothetical protein
MTPVATTRLGARPDSFHHVRVALQPFAASHFPYVTFLFRTRIYHTVFGSLSKILKRGNSQKTFTNWKNSVRVSCTRGTKILVEFRGCNRFVASSLKIADAAASSLKIADAAAKRVPCYDTTRYTVHDNKIQDTPGVVFLCTTVTSDTMNEPSMSLFLWSHAARLGVELQQALRRWASRKLSYGRSARQDSDEMAKIAFISRLLRVWLHKTLFCLFLKTLISKECSKPNA